MSTKLNFLQDIKTLFMKPLLEKFRRNSRQEKRKKNRDSIKASQYVSLVPSNSSHRHVTTEANCNQRLPSLLKTDKQITKSA